MARIVLRDRTHRRTHFATFFRFGFSGLGVALVLFVGDLLPAVALVAARRVASVNRRDHLYVGVPELPRDELVGRAGAHRAIRVEVAITLRFGVDEQHEFNLPSAEGSATKKKPPKVSRVLDDVIATARAYANGGPRAVRAMLIDEDYTQNAVQLLRALSPDATRVATVGMTIVRRGKPVPVALPDRGAYDAPAVYVPGGKLEALPALEYDVEGTLLAANATNRQRQRVVVVTDNGQSARFEYDEAAHGDIVNLHWKRRVRARLRRRGNGAVLVHMYPA